MAQLIVALDVPSADEAERLIDQLYELDVIFKIGMESLYGYPERIFSYCEARDVRYFVDAKLHDIPRTVGAAIRHLVRPGAHIVNVHALGGHEMMCAAVEAAQERAAEIGMTVPHVFAVTILTSHAAAELRELGLQGGPGENATRLAALARGVLERDFRVTDAPQRAVCDGCPAEGGLCSWPLDMTRREAADRLF